MVKSGYKQTEIGMIPEDWDIGTFKNVGEFFKGSGISMRDIKSTGFPCIMYGDIYVKFDTHFKKCDFKIDENTAKRSTKAISNDLFFTASGETAEDIGKCVSYQGEEDIFIGGDIIAIRPKNEYNSLFLAFVQNSSPLIKQKATLAQGHTVVHINRDSIASLVFAYPELKEQERIAEALSNVDELISSLEKLIEKYKSIKSTCLQQMFPQKGETTPKMRLPGFNGAWEQRKVGDFTNVLSASRVHKNEWVADGIPFYRSSDVVSAFRGTDNEKVFIPTELYEELIKSSGKLEKDDILITGGGSIGIPYIVPDNEPLYSKDADLIWVKKSTEHDSEYLYSYFTSHVFCEYISSISHVGTIAHYTIEQVKYTPVQFPTITEQRAIGSFFRRLDNLITLHQRKLDKAKKIKQGMMQQLLTGKIRLL